MHVHENVPIYVCVNSPDFYREMGGGNLTDKRPEFADLICQLFQDNNSFRLEIKDYNQKEMNYGRE